MAASQRHENPPAPSAVPYHQLSASPPSYLTRVKNAIAEDFLPNLIPINVAAGVAAMVWEGVSIAEGVAWIGTPNDPALYVVKYGTLGALEGGAACLGFWGTRRLINNQILARTKWPEFGGHEKNEDARREAMSGAWPAVMWQGTYDATTALDCLRLDKDSKVSDFATFAWRSDNNRYSKELVGLGLFIVPSLISKIPYSGFWIANWQEVLMTWFGAVGFALATDYTIKNNIPLVFQTALDGTVGGVSSTFANIGLCGAGQFALGTVGGVLYHFLNEIRCGNSASNSNQPDVDNHDEKAAPAPVLAPTTSASNTTSSPATQPEPTVASATTTPLLPGNDRSSTVTDAIETAAGLFSTYRVVSALSVALGVSTSGASLALTTGGLYTAKKLYDYYKLSKSKSTTAETTESTKNSVTKTTVTLEPKKPAVTTSTESKKPASSFFNAALSYGCKLLPRGGIFGGRKQSAPAISPTQSCAEVRIQIK